MAELKLTNITKRFGDVVAVDDISLEVHDGEFLVLLGPSGCGKTTAMRMIAGLEEVTEGEISIDDVDVTDLPPRKRNVSMIFQNYAVWPHMTVFDNIAYALKLKKMDKATIEQTVQEVADMTGIGNLLKRYPSQLSGGQQQRVAVARAIAVKPKVFLMDEPLSNLDAMLRVTMRTELKAIHVKTEATTVFVTHDQSEAMSMADRIVVMRDGQIIQVGTPNDVYDKSDSVFVASFIGTPPTNFMEVELQQSNGSYSVRSEHLDLPLDDQQSDSLVKDGKKFYTLGIRPENINLVDEADAVLSVPCLVAEPQGSHQIIAAEVDGKIFKIVAPPLPKANPGEMLHVAFKPGSEAFFDKETGVRI